MKVACFIVAYFLLDNRNFALGSCSGSVNVGDNKKNNSKYITVIFETAFCQIPSLIETAVLGEPQYPDTFKAEVNATSKCGFAAVVTRGEQQTKTWWQAGVFLNWTARFELPTGKNGPQTTPQFKVARCDEANPTCLDGLVCEAKQRGCSENSSWNSSACVCLPGFAMNGSTCQDVNECSSGTHICNENATCTNHIGSFSCSCKAGFSGDGVDCADINECQDSPNICQLHATCSNTVGSYSCQCQTGFSEEGSQCTDINECLSDRHNCSQNAICTNRIGSFSCACKTGFSGDGVMCPDIDECQDSPSICQLHATCSNTVGNYSCQCQTGFFETLSLCLDIDECADESHNCHKHAACTNEPGTYSCYCKSGFTGNGSDCIDLNECMMENHGCHDNATCVNTQGSYTCVCLDGFTRNGTYCEDVDECQSDMHGCHEFALCANFPGSHTCICNSGFRGNGSYCADINECKAEADDCHDNATCLNEVGKFSCQCKNGFQGNGSNCTDVNECDRQSISCHPNATCLNLQGGFQCSCHQGLFGDGHNCYDIDECLKKTHDCDKNATCTNRMATYECQCDHHFRGDGKNCTEFCDFATLDGFSFESAAVGHNQTSNERCPGGIPASTAFCGAESSSNRAMFKHFPFNGCNMDLDQIRKLSKTTADFVIASRHVAALVNGGNNLTQEEVNGVVLFLDDMKRLANSGKINVSTSTFTSVLSVVDGLIESQWNVSGQRGSESDQMNQQNVVKSVSSLALDVKLNRSDPKFKYQSNAFTMEVKDDNGTDFPKLEFTTNDAVDVVLPPTAVRSAWATSSGDNVTERRSAFVYYKDDSLFYSKSGVNSVISVDVGKAGSVENLTEPVEIRFLDQHAQFAVTPLKNNSLQALKTTAECVYWDFNTSSWLSDGCCLNTTANPPECLCYHLTNFALIIKSEKVPTDAALTVVSYVGCIASICGLALTIALHLWLREVRRRRPVKILVNICANLLVADALFLAGVARSTHPAACTAVTAFLHYFLLSTWCWMTVYSYDMYMSVVKVFRNDGSKFLQRVSAFAYITPGIIVVLTVGIAVGYFDQLPQRDSLCNAESNPFHSSAYRANNMCWLKGYSLYIGFLLPIGILLVFNLICFLLIFREIICKKMEGRTRAMKRSRAQNIVIALTMSTVMGMTWLFGYFMLLSEDPTYLVIMSWLFAVANSMQGLSIFVLTTLRSKELRRVWWNPLRMCCGQTSNATSRFIGSISLKTSVGTLRTHDGHNNTSLTEASNGHTNHTTTNHTTTNFTSSVVNNAS